MRILYHHRTQGQGVEKVHILGVVKAFKKLGHEVNIISPPGITVETERTTSRNVKASTFRYFAENSFEFVFELAEVFYNLISIFRVGYQLKRSNYHFIYERYAMFGFAVTLIALSFKIPIIIEVNDASFVDRVRPLKYKKLASIIEKWVFNRATAIIVVSEYFKKLICEIGINEKNILVIPNAIDPENFVTNNKGNWRKKLDIQNTDIVIGFVGKIVPWHGIEMFLEILSEIMKGDDKIKVLLVGDSSLANGVIKNLEHAHERLILTGQVSHEDVPAYLNCMDIVILPNSNKYGSPMKLFEYMAAGKLIVAPRLGPICEILEDGKDAILFEASNTERMKEALIKSIALYQGDMGNKAKSKVLKKHTWHQNAKKIIEILDSRFKN